MQVFVKNRKDTVNYGEQKMDLIPNRSYILSLCEGSWRGFLSQVPWWFHFCLSEFISELTFKTIKTTRGQSSEIVTWNSLEMEAERGAW